MLNQVLSSTLFAEELRVTLCNACCRVWLSKQYPFSAQKESKRWMSCGSTWMAVSKELTQITTPQTVRCSGVGMAGGRTVPAQNQDRLNHHGTSRGRHREPLTSHPFAPQSVELQPFPLEVLPSLIPSHMELPTIPRAANASVLFLGRPSAGFIPVCTNR